MITLDFETCGFHGMPVLLQWARDDGPIYLHEIWHRPVRETLELIEFIANHKEGICGFNLSFDWFHMCKLYTTWSLLDGDIIPEECVDHIAVLEKEARDGPCLKPVTSSDLMLWARKSHYQVLMERSDIRIKKVPTPLAYSLAKELEKRVKLDRIFFAKKKNPFAPQWSVFDITDEDGDIEPNFKDVVLKFAPSSGLKTLAAHALKLPPDSILLFANIEVDKQYLPVEDGYSPYALSIGKPGEWNGAWPDVIHRHIAHWSTNKLAREYAEKDVDLTRKLYKHFDSPESGDDDSILACMVAACRWKGYKIDVDGIKALRLEAKKKIGAVPTAPGAAKRWLDQVLSPEEQLFLSKGEKFSTKRPVLEKIAEFEDMCEKCEGEGCDDCKGIGKVKAPSAIRARAILDARFSKYEIQFYDKLIQAGRLHADLNVIGALSSRMSGASGLNVQGIKKTKQVRRNFQMAFEDEILLGGDFKSFEVVIAIAVYGDEKLYHDVTTPRECYKCKGKKGGCTVCKDKGVVDPKIHAIMGTFFYPHLTYQQIVESDGSDNDYYTKAKSGFFALIYGGESYTLQNRLGVTEDNADKAYEQITRTYPKVGEARQQIKDRFSAMKQVGGIGTRIEWTDPDEYVEEPVLGHRRYYTLENMITKELFNLAQKPPAEWRSMEFVVTRRDREQKIAGAVSSALYAAAFSVRSGVVRSAQNHQIQSSGAKLCKNLQRRIWDLQPSGISKWIVRPLNAHDEILTPCDPEYKDQVFKVVENFLIEFRQKVKLLAIDFKQMNNWGEK
jgi:hypothetical protein